MWLLVLFLVFDDGRSARLRFATEELHYATEQQCHEAQTWWLAHGEALPQGYAKPWRQLTGPECEPADDLVS